MRQRAQHGFVLISLVALLVMGALAFLVSNLSPEFMQAYRQRQTDAALMQAREALLGYALRFREANPDAANVPVYMYGYLPLPDLGTSRNNNSDCPSEGCDADFTGNAANITVIGRFPWRMLGTGPLRDSHGECLWYAVSGSHQGIQMATPMNWDTLGQLDIVVANGTAAMQSTLASAHNRPIAIIFSPGPPLAGQDRSPSVTDDVSECGGNYDARNYLDPGTAATLGGVTNYFATATNAASGITGDSNPSNDPDIPKAFSIQGMVQQATNNTLWPGDCPAGLACSPAANDKGLALTGDLLFATLRKSSLFRLDINSMLDRMTDCLRDIGVASPSHPLASNPCYDDSQDPKNYFSSYQDQLFAAPCAGNCAATIDGVTPATTCPAVLIFANQRNTANQVRITAADKADPLNYLEAPNANSFMAPDVTYSGASMFSSVTTTAPAYQDIVRCIPAEPSFTPVESTTLTSLGFGQLSSYDAATRTLTLGSLNLTTGAVGTANAAALFGCAWQDLHSTGSGVRGYFMFNITNTGFPGPGFTFAAVDGDRNTAGVCGAASQHLGYSGNNGSTPSIAAPKIGVEFDTLRNFRSKPPFLPNGFDPSRVSATKLDTLNNGRADPGYTGGHIAVVYWGGDAPISTGQACTVTADCKSPSFCDAGVCKLLAEEDDNVHGQLPSPPAVRPPPGNPVPPTNPPPSPPPYPPPGVTKLDPSLSSTPTNQNIHVRVEIERSYAGRDDNSRLVRLVASSPITLSGLQTIDAVAILAGDTVLVTAQTDAKTNGVYLASAGAWTRDASADESIDLPPGTSWFIKNGAANAGSLWRLQNSSTPVINIDALSIQRVRLPVRTVATAPISLSALQTVNGVALAVGNRVLVTAQATSSQNGVYLASSGAWARATPENVSAGMKDGSMWLVSAGSHTGEYWRLNGDATPGASNPISIAPASANDRYAATVQTQVWMLKDSVTTANQIARMKTTTRSMAQLDPVIRYGQCSPGVCATGQSCGVLESDNKHYCYNAGQQPNLYDRQTIYDEQGSACTSGAACSDGQFCGIDNLCYKPALRTLRLGFTNSQDSRDQVISISNFSKTWLP